MKNDSTRRFVEAALQEANSTARDNLARALADTADQIEDATLKFVRDAAAGAPNAISGWLDSTRTISVSLPARWETLNAAAAAAGGEAPLGDQELLLLVDKDKLTLAQWRDLTTVLMATMNAMWVLNNAVVHNEISSATWVARMQRLAEDMRSALGPIATTASGEPPPDGTTKH
jgi:hypothetical protein